ncbi:MAG TPA: alpha/beta fold hydrolase [Terriglobales bacterium]|jgi:pimeloyl-ACP methyl ester carboxylesterase|nr:alpha/beta fold hydrolase [Terriglobales bacterium]
MPHSITRDGVRIYFEEHGRGEPVLLAYGIGGNAGMWEPNIDALSAHHRLILWEPRGHARSDSPEDPRQVTFAHWVMDLQGLLDHLKIDRAIVGGLSLGGGIATRFTLAHPARVRALIIVDSSSASGLPLGVDNIVMRAKSIEVTLAGGMDAMAEFAIASNPNVAGRIKLDPSARKEVFDYYRMLTPIGYANALRALLQMDYITDRLGEIKVPTLLVCGDEDPSLGPMREIQRRIPHATFALLSPAGHFGNRDQPEAFNRAVSDFLKSLA